MRDVETRRTLENAMCPAEGSNKVKDLGFIEHTRAPASLTPTASSILYLSWTFSGGTRVKDPAEPRANLLRNAVRHPNLFPPCVPSLPASLPPTLSPCLPASYTLSPHPFPPLSNPTFVCLCLPIPLHLPKHPHGFLSHRAHPDGDWFISWVTHRPPGPAHILAQSTRARRRQ